MGIYYCAIDRYRKEKIEPPKDFIIKFPGIFGPTSPFPGMVIMMNVFGYNFEIINDSDWEGPFYDSSYKDITNEVYEKYLSFFYCFKCKNELVACVCMDDGEENEIQDL